MYTKESNFSSDYIARVVYLLTFHFNIFKYDGDVFYIFGIPCVL